MIERMMSYLRMLPLKEQNLIRGLFFFEMSRAQTGSGNRHSSDDASLSEKQNPEETAQVLGEALRCQARSSY